MRQILLNMSFNTFINPQPSFLVRQCRVATPLDARLM